MSCAGCCFNIMPCCGAMRVRGWPKPRSQSSAWASICNLAAPRKQPQLRICARRPTTCAPLVGPWAHPPPTAIRPRAATRIMGCGKINAEHCGASGPEVNGKVRDGDVRRASCTMDGSKAALGWEPKVMVEEGVRRLCDWIDASRS